MYSVFILYFLIIYLSNTLSDIYFYRHLFYNELGDYMMYSNEAKKVQVKLLSYIVVKRLTNGANARSYWLEKYDSI
jgi:hypothetical protein